MRLGRCDGQVRKRFADRGRQRLALATFGDCRHHEGRARLNQAVVVTNIPVESVSCHPPRAAPLARLDAPVAHDGCGGLRPVVRVKRQPTVERVRVAVDHRHQRRHARRRRYQRAVLLVPRRVVDAVANETCAERLPVPAHVLPRVAPHLRDRALGRLGAFGVPLAVGKSGRGGGRQHRLLVLGRALCRAVRGRRVILPTVPGPPHEWVGAPHGPRLAVDAHQRGRQLVVEQKVGNQRLVPRHARREMFGEQRRPAKTRRVSAATVTAATVTVAVVAAAATRAAADTNVVVAAAAAATQNVLVSADTDFDAHSFRNIGIHAVADAGSNLWDQSMKPRWREKNSPVVLRVSRPTDRPDRAPRACSRSDRANQNRPSR